MRERQWWQRLGKPERSRLLRFYHALERRYGPFDLAMKEHARAVTEAWWRAAEASEEAMAAMQTRRYGTGKRIGAMGRERLAKRSGKDAETYNRLLARLMAMTVRRDRGPSRWQELPGDAGEQPP